MYDCDNKFHVYKVLYHVESCVYLVAIENTFVSDTIFLWYYLFVLNTISACHCTWTLNQVK